MVGGAYREGTDVPRATAESARWYRKAAEQGLSQAQVNLGALYLSGYGVPEDLHQAFKWFHKAALQGVSTAQWAVGLAFANGDGVKRSDLFAYMWLKIAVDQGHVKAAEHLQQIIRGMATRDVSKGRELVDQCRNSGYEQCGPLTR